MKKGLFNIMRFFAALGVLVLQWGCQQPAGGDAGEEQNVTLSIDRPSDGATVAQVDTIEVNASGQFRKLEIYVDSVLVKTFFTAPFNYRWLAGYWADGGTHTIRAVARNDDGNVVGSDEIRVTIPNTVGITPELVSPIQNRILTNPDVVEFSWEATEEAKEYRFQLAADEQFQRLKTQQVLTKTRVALPIPDAGVYYWRVRAIHQSGQNGPWSVPFAVEIRRVVTATLSSIQALVFDKRCAIPNCHVGEYAAQGLDLSRGNSYDHLVYVYSFEVPSMYLVEPYASSRSYLITKLEGGDSLQGAQMPLSGEKLSQSVIDSIKKWIDIGAPNN